MHQQINLYQPMFRKQRKLFSFTVSVRVVAIIVVAMLSLYLLGTLNLERAEKDLTELKLQNELRLTQLAGISEQLKSLNGGTEVAHKIDLLEQELEAEKYLLEILGDVYVQHRQGFSDYLEGFARRVVKGMWITRFDMQNGGKDVMLSGGAMVPDSVPTFIEQLAEEPRLIGTHFEILTMQRQDTGKAWVDFTLASGGFKQSPFDEKPAAKVER